MATIDIRIQRIDQLFDSLAPSPFLENEKALRRDAENYIVDFAGSSSRTYSAGADINGACGSVVPC